MEILFTGGSSFTGYWFIKELTAAGHRVTAVFRRSPESYSGLRKERIDALAPLCHQVFDCEFGSHQFLDVIAEANRWDLFCHHAADVTNYKSPQFDIAGALANNTKNLPTVLERLLKKQCHKVLLTGSVFEQNEGTGSEPLSAFSPYGLSKGFTAEVFKYYTHLSGMKLGKFVIPNPFGPYEEPRYTSYLIQNWIEGKVAMVNTPDYVRDNIHVSLLAKAYAYFAQRLSKSYEKFNPSGYVESQGEFTQRFANEMSKRLALMCEFDLAKQHLFPEPRVRTNTDSLDNLGLEWDEEKAWDGLANYYQLMMQAKKQ